MPSPSIRISESLTQNEGRRHKGCRRPRKSGCEEIVIPGRWRCPRARHHGTQALSGGADFGIEYPSGRRTSPEPIPCRPEIDARLSPREAERRSVDK